MNTIPETHVSSQLEFGGALNDAGFTVLEALIAIALLAAAFIPLLEIQSQFVRVTESLDRAQTRITQEKLVHNFMQTVNFDQQPTGSIVLNNRAIEWSVDVVSPPEFVKSPDGGNARFSVTFYDVSVNYTPIDIQFISGERTYSLPGIGWTARRPVIEGL